MVDGGQIYFIRTDHIGRPVFATNDLGVKVWEASYLPFGGVHVSTGGIDLRFPGQWFQAESGLHQNWMRDYDPTTGRYIQADPLGLVPGPGLYDYAYQNPMYWTDPTGECPWCAAIVVGAGIGVVTGYLLDQVFGDGCYSWSEFLTDAVLGGLFGGGGFAATGLKKAGTEFSHTIPTRIMNNGNRTMKWLDRRSNPYRALNGNYVKPWFHAKTDYYRRVKNMSANDMFSAPVRFLLRLPAWVAGGAGGGVVGGSID